MKKQVIILFVLTTMLLMNYSQDSYSQDNDIKLKGKGTITREVRKLDAFDKLSAKGAYKLFINQSDNVKVEVETNENLQQYIETYVDNDELIIRTKDGYSIRNSDEMNIIISVPDLKKLSIWGAVIIDQKNKLIFNELNVDVFGSSSIDINLEANVLNLESSGVSRCRFYGKTNKLNVNTSGMVVLDAINFKAKECDLYLSGFGKSQIFVTEELNIDVSGFGKVEYWGNPKEVNNNSSSYAIVRDIL